MKLTIKKASFHRNGVGGMGFFAIVFHNHEEKRDMIASLFDDPGYCAVYDIGELSKENIELANGNSWRGDRYEDDLRPLLEKYLADNEGDRAGPFSINPNIFKNLE